MQKKAILFIADGLGGRPSDMDGETCLEVADTPNLNKMASRGINGLLDPVKRGVRPGSDTSHLSLFGYNPEDIYSGRGVFEASGAFMDIEEGDVCFRTNFATVDENMGVVDRRAGRIEKGQDKLEEALNNMDLEEFPEVEINFKATTQHRGALVLKGEGLSDKISDTDPHEEGHIKARHIDSSEPGKPEETFIGQNAVEVEKSKALDGSEEAKKTARIVNKISQRAHEILTDMEFNERREEEGKLAANALLLRGASKKPDIPDFEDKYGLEGVGIAAGALYLGVVREVGMKAERPEGATGDVGTNFMEKAKTAVDKLEENDFVYLHVKATDNAAHDHDAEKKVRCIEKVDEMVGYLLDNLDWESTHMVFTGDHTTPVNFGDHTAEPVPIVYYGPEVREDDVEEIGERPSAKGDLGEINGQHVVSILFNYNDWMKKFGS